MEVVRNAAYLVKVIGISGDDFDGPPYEIFLQNFPLKGYGFLKIEDFYYKVEIHCDIPPNKIKRIILKYIGRKISANRLSLLEIIVPESLEEESGENLLGRTLELYLDPETTLERIFGKNLRLVGRYGWNLGNRGLYPSEVFRRL